MPRMTRRDCIKALGLASASTVLPSRSFGGAFDSSKQMLKAIPSSGEKIPTIGMGTWLTFNVPTSGPIFEGRLKVLREFFRLGGGLVDSSPMYGNAEAALGACLQRLDAGENLFSATKVWAVAAEQGREQFENSFSLWSQKQFDLQQVHNLVNWQAHIKLLRAAKEEGRIRYIGVTTSHGRRHPELKEIMKQEPLDFVQLTYNAARTEAEPVIELAAERGIAVIVNRPLGGGRLIARVQRVPLPSWAKDLGIRHWPDFLLRWITSRPGVTCAIPATTQVVHMQENMSAGRAPILDAGARQRMQRYISQL